MKQPIKPEDIRKGDLIRAEWSKEADAAYEFRAKHDRDTMGVRGGLFGELSGWAGADRFTLLDRPTPPVELPTEPTLGILFWGQGDDVSCREGRWCADDDRVWQHNVNGTRTNHRGVTEVTGFERTYALPDGAVAVPKTALDELRSERRRARTLIRAADRGQVREEALDAFLAAVDEANGSDQ